MAKAIRKFSQLFCYLLVKYMNFNGWNKALPSESFFLSSSIFYFCLRRIVYTVMALEQKTFLFVSALAFELWKFIRFSINNQIVTELLSRTRPMFSWKKCFWILIKFHLDSRLTCCFFANIVSWINQVFLWTFQSLNLFLCPFRESK